MSINQCPAPALARGLQLINIISKEKEIGFNELLQKSKLNTSSLNRLLKVLLDYGYITKNSNNKYTLGLKLIAISQRDSIWQSLIHASSLILTEINEKFGFTAVLIGYNNEEMICLDKSVNSDNISMLEIGSIQKDFISRSWGLLYLSTLPEPDMINLFNKSISYLPKNINAPSLDTVKFLLDFTRKNNYTDDLNIFYKNSRRIAFPIYYNNNLIASIAIGTINELLKDEKEKELISYLKDKTNQISLLLGGEIFG